ncbi:MAG: fumarylacetoacetate hydrolase family protein [Burkholderiales bacterium]
MSFLPTGTVHGTALNFRGEREALGARMSEPHKAPLAAAPGRPKQGTAPSGGSEVHAVTNVGALPIAPVLYVKPANTWTAHGGAVVVPAGAAELWVGATISMVFGPLAPASASFSAMERVAGYVLMNDFSLPQPNLFRPPIKFNCLDGFLGIGNQLVPAAEAGDPAAFVLEVRIDGELKQTIRFAELVRPAARLVADVSEFMTLREGDVLMLGTDLLAGGAHLSARAGQRIDISAAGFPTLSNTLVAEVV